jgi:hypothetical protein
MANVQVAGFQPLYRDGQTVSLARKRVLTNNTTAIFKHDAVINVTTGDVIVTAATTTSAYSVSQAASYYSGGTRIERPYLPAATLYATSGIDPVDASYVYVVADMVGTAFKASIDEAMVLLDNFLNYAIVLGTGNTGSGMSGHELDATGRAVTATLPWRVDNFVIGDPNVDIALADAHVICKLNAGSRDPALEISGSLGT